MKNVKKILSVFCVFVLFSTCLYLSNLLVINKTSLQKYQPFIDSKQDFDVLFFGSSHVINGISPLDLFHNYGITSYNLSMHGNGVLSAYYLLQETIDILKKGNRQLPDTVVLDIYAFDSATTNLHKAWDNFPFYSNKLSMVVNTIEKKEQFAMLFPFSLYHNRWNELKRNDFQPSFDKWYGVELVYGLVSPAELIISDPSDCIPMEKDKIECLNNIKELCDSHNIRLILIHIPYSYAPDRQREANSVLQYAKSKDIPYINYMNEDIGINFDTDFYDQGHLNVSGMRKMTNALGKLLSEFGLPDYRQNPNYSEWIEAYNDFTDYRIQRFKGLKQASLFLMSLNDPDFTSEIRIKESILEDPLIEQLVQQLKDNNNEIIVTEYPSQIKKDADNTEAYDIYCTVYHKNKQDDPIYSVGFLYNEIY